MNPDLAAQLLILGLTRLADFGVVIRRARAEGRDVTPEEVAASGLQAQGSLDALDAKIKAAGG